MAAEQALQDQLPADSPGRQCYGCGADNERGMRIKSFWEADEVVCRWSPEPYHAAIGSSFLSGGVAATIMDCHSLWTVVATVAREQGLSIAGPMPVYLTRSIKVDFLRPTPVDGELLLRARVTKMGDRSATVTCSLYAGRIECVRAETVAVLVG